MISRSTYVVFLSPDFSKEAAHMEVVDRLNQQLGAGLDKPWQMQRQWRSPRYTSNWSELPVVVA